MAICASHTHRLISRINLLQRSLFSLSAQSGSENVDDVDATAEDDGSELGAAAPPIPPQSLRRQPTPEEAERYAEVARQLNEVARQIETQYSNDLDEMVDSLNLVTEVAYDAFAGDDRAVGREL